MSDEDIPETDEDLVEAEIDDDDLDLDDVDVDDALDDAVVDIDAAVDGAVIEAAEGAVDVVDADAAPKEVLKARVTDDEEDEEVDLDDEAHPDDVEDALDVVLRERTKQATLVEDGEEDDDDDEAPARRSAIKGETFVCSSCYFVKPIHQLVDPDNKICIDCA